MLNLGQGFGAIRLGRSVLGGAAACVALVGYPTVARADTISGTLTADTTLTPAGSPYSVPGDLEVPVGVTLTIQPGVTLTFAAGSVTPNLGVESTAELVVRGALVAAGTSENPIVFQGTSATGRGVWGGIAFLGSVPPTLHHAVFKNPFIAVRPLSSGLTVTADHLLITDCSAGAHAYFGDLVLDSVTIRNCLEGLGTIITNNLTATNVVLDGNGTGLEGESSGSFVVTNATIYGGGTGANGGVTVQNAIITHANVGVSGAAQVLNSDVFGNQTDYAGATPGAGTISADPLFVAAPTDLSLSAGSPCIDTGAAAGAPNHDLVGTTRPLDGDAVNGPAFDMGAFEYVRPPRCGDGLVEGTEECDDGNTVAGDGCDATCNSEIPGAGGSAGSGESGGGGDSAGSGGSEAGGTAGEGGGHGHYPFCSYSPRSAGERGGTWFFVALGLVWGLGRARRRVSRSA